MSSTQFRKWVEAIGGRRFLLALGAGIMSSILVWFTKISSETYQWVILGTVGAFISAATWQKTKVPGDPTKKDE